MKKSILLGNQNVRYDLKKNARSRGVRLSVGSDGLLVTLPKRVSRISAERFILQKSEWILKTLEEFNKNSEVSHPKFTKEEIAAYKQKANTRAAERLAYFNSFYNFTYARVSIKNQKTRWGSCSRKGNLNFNYKIALLPLPLVDYIVVHELCHLKQMNHSPAFWKLVAQTIPDYAVRRKQLRTGSVTPG